jgi:hypothetical protein
MNAGAGPMGAAPRRVLAAMALLGALAAGGCAVAPRDGDPPVDWALVRGATQQIGCPDLTGAYANQPADVHPKTAARPPRLSEIFGLEGKGVGVFGARDPDRPWPALAGATTAWFKADGDALLVRFRDGVAGEALLKLHGILVFAPEREWDAYYHCWGTEFGPAMRFPGPRIPIGGVPGEYGELDLQIVSLLRGKDGALIVNHRTDRHRFTAPPHGAAGSQVRTMSGTWWRYPAVDRYP